jgi:hypothetical protein
MYGAQQYNMSQMGGGYGMPSFDQPQYGQQGGYAQQQYGQFQQQQAPQATGKGAAPAPAQQPQQQAPQATGKGAAPAQQPPQATGKGMSTGGRAGYADGGRIGYLGGGPIPGDPYGVLQAQQASFAGAPGAGAGYVPAVQASGQRQMLQPQKSILPEQKSGIKEAIGMGTSIASLGEAGNKLYDKLSGPKTTGAQDAQKAFDKMGAAKQSVLDEAGGLSAPKSGFKLFGENSATPDLGGLNPEVASIDPSILEGFDPSMLAGFAARGGRIGYSAGGIPGLDDLKQGQAGIPGGEGLETPMSHVVAQGTQTPAELKAQMNSMSSGAGGLGGGSGGGGLGSAIGTAASVISLGNAAMTAGSWIGANVLPAMMAFSDRRMKTDIKAIGKTFDGQTIHRYKYKGDPKTQIGLIAQEVEKAHPTAVGLAGGMKTVNYDTATREAAKRGHFADGGSAMLDLENPQDQAMAEAFDNLLERYDNNPLLAAAAMDVGTKAVDAAIQKAQQTGGDITDFLPRRTQEYMFALSKAAMGAHDAMSREARAAGGRTGYALPGSVDDQPTGLAPAPSDAMTMGDVTGGLSPEPTVQVADLKNPDILRALRGVEGANDNPEAKNPNSTAGGLYQYVDKTWQAQAPLAGVDIKQYPTARSAPAEIQHQVADANVSRILEQNKGNVQAVPHMWYAGNVEGKLSPEGLAANKGFTQEQYNQRFFNKFGAGAPEEKPTQVATATGLAPKTDAGPFERTIGKILPDAVPTDSSFWVPLIAGLGTMLASDKYRFSQRLGEGLVGGAAAYGKSQEFGLKKQELEQKGALQQSEILKNTMGIAAARFRPLGGNKWYDNQTGQSIGLEEYQNRLSKITGAPAPAPAVAAPATETSTAPTTAPVTAPTVAPATSTAPATEQAPAPDVSSAAAPAQVLPASIATQRVIYESIDLLPEVKAVKDQAQKMRDQAHQYLEKANDPALMGTKEGNEFLRFSSDASARANELQTQYRDLRDRLAKPEIDELNRKAERSGRLEQVQPNAGGPTVYRTQEDILNDIKTNGAAQSANPGAGNPVSGAAPAAVVAKQPEYLAKRMENITENELKMGQQFKDRQPMRQRIDNLSQIVEAYQTGAFAENKADAIRWARSLGFDINDTDTANPAAFQKFRKNSINNVIEQAKSLAGPIAFKELDLIGKANTDADMEPDAVVSLLGDAKGMLNYEDAFYKDYAKWRKNNKQNPYPDFEFNIDWVEKNPTSKYVDAAKKDVAALGQKLPNDPSKTVHGQKYILTRPGAFGPHYWDAKKQQFFRSKPAPLED